MAAQRRRALLIEQDESLQTLNSLVLEAIGFEVRLVPPDEDALAFAIQSSPNVVVVHLDEELPELFQIIDRLRDNPRTQCIPICAIATSDKLAAEAQASPNVPVTLIAPYDLDALEQAVVETVESPPASAVLPNPPRVTPGYVTIVGEALNREARPIVLEVVFHRLRRREPYRTLFSSAHDQLIQLVDHLGTILGVIITGLRRELDPGEVFHDRYVIGYVDEHIRLRREQGLGACSAVDEYQMLRDACLAVVQDVAQASQVTAAEAVEATRRILNLTDALVRIVVAKYENDS